MGRLFYWLRFNDIVVVLMRFETACGLDLYMMAALMIQYHARMTSRACWNGWNTSDSSRYKTKGTSLYSSFSSLKVVSLFIPNDLFREPFPMHPCKNFWGGKRSRSFWTSSWARIGEWSVMQSSSCSNIIFRLTSSWDCLPKVSYQPEIQSRWSKIRGKVWKSISSMLHLRRNECFVFGIDVGKNPTAWISCHTFGLHRSSTSWSILNWTPRFCTIC